MLKSGQLSQEALAKVLVEEYYLAFYRLHALLLEDPLLAHVAVVETFIRVLANLHRYREQVPALWLYGFALQAARDLSSHPPSPADLEKLGRLLPARQPPSGIEAELKRAVYRLDVSGRAALYLACVQAWPTAQIASLLKLDEPQANRLVSQAIRASEVEAALLARSLGQRPADDPCEHLRQAFVAAWPAPAFDDQEEQAVIAQVLVQGEQRGRRSQQANTILEFTLISVLILFVAVGAWGLSSLLSDSAPERAIETIIVTRLVYVEPTPQIVEVYQAVTAAPKAVATQVWEQPAAFYLVQEGDSLDKVAAELGGIDPNALWQALGMPDASIMRPGSQLKIPGRLVPRSRETPIPAADPNASLAPLTITSSSQEISAHLLRPAWRSANLWLELQTITRGPTAYNGPARIEGLRIWLSPEQILLFQALPAEAPEDTILFRFRSIPVSARLPAEQFDAEDVFALPKYRLSLYQIAHPIDSQLLANGQASFRVRGIEEILGRSTLAVDQLDVTGAMTARLWLDLATDLPLRIEKYQDGAAQPTYELQVRRVVYNLDLTDESESKSPRRPSGQPFEALPGQAAPPAFALAAELGSLAPAPHGFDLARSPLTFHYPDDLHPLAPESSIRISADGYDLGEFSFGNPWSLVCDRSPDGARLAFISQPGLNPPRDAGLRWIDLTTPSGGTHGALAGIYMSELAFAPDSRQVAAFGRYISIDAVYIVDTHTGQYRRLLRLASARSLVWSPDMQYLALIGSRQDAPDVERVLVIQLRRGRIIYDEPFNPLLPADQQYPALAWGVEFPAPLQGLGKCAIPAAP